jgi:hypothetical protein
MAEMGIRCSKCKKTKEVQYFHCMGKYFKTCSLCRWTARDRTTRRNIMRGMSLLSTDYNDTDSVISTSANDASDAADVAFMIAAFAGVSISSSSSAAACSSANYFVEEPEEEPEP